VKSTYWNLDIYVVDNGCTDDSCEFVRLNYPNVKLLRFTENLGFAEAYNRATRFVEADYVVRLNNDTTVELDFISVLVKRAESDPGIGSVGCRIVQADAGRRYGPVFFTGRGLFIGPLFFGSAIGKSAVYSIYENPTECLANSAAAVLYRKSVIDAIGLYDSDFWSDWEDHDLGFRICIAGYRNLYTPETRVSHVGAAGFGSVYSRTRVTRMTKNMLLTYMKNYDPKNIVMRFFPLISLIIPYRDIAVILENESGLLLRRDVTRRKKLRETYGTSLTANLQFLRCLRCFMKKRQHVQSLRKVTDHLAHLKKHYLNRIRRYS
jgi:GT2 family glycosyltransferase